MKKYILSIALYFIVISTSHANMNSEKDFFEKQTNIFNECTETFNTHEKECPEVWTMKCYDHMMSAHKEIQDCYKKVAVNVFMQFYNLSQNNAEDRVKKFTKFVYEQYLFVNADTNYCQKENCGVSPHLLAQYSTTSALSNYILQIFARVNNYI